MCSLTHKHMTRPTCYSFGYLNCQVWFDLSNKAIQNTSSGGYLFGKRKNNVQIVLKRRKINIKCIYVDQTIYPPCCPSKYIRITVLIVLYGNILTNQTHMIYFTINHIIRTIFALEFIYTFLHDISKCIRNMEHTLQLHKWPTCVIQV